MGQYTEMLFARPSTIEGIARIFDFSDALSSYNTSNTSEEADIKALKSDWQAVGNDLKNAMKKIGIQNSDK